MDEGDKGNPTVKNIMKIVGDYFDLKTGSFVVPIILYCIAFSQLFDHLPTEYLSWLLILLLNCTFPFTWLQDLYKIVLTIRQNNRIKGEVLRYSFFAIAITYALQFVVFLFIALKNESVRKAKERRGEYDDDTKMNNIKTDNRTVEKRDKLIGILVITTNLILWVLSANYFTTFLTKDMYKSDKNLYNDNGSDRLNEALKEDFPIGFRMKRIVELIPEFLEQLDTGFHWFIEKYVPFSKLQSSAFLYCAAFLASLFTIFLRIKYKKETNKYTGTERYAPNGFDIVNLNRLFGEDFYRNTHHYRNLAYVLLSVIIGVGTFAIGLFLFVYLFKLEYGLPISLALGGISLLSTIGSIAKDPPFESHDKHYFTTDVTVNDLDMDASFDHYYKDSSNNNIIGTDVKTCISGVALDLYNNYFIYENDDNYSNISSKSEDQFKYLKYKYNNILDELKNADNLDDLTKDDNKKLNAFFDVMERIYAEKNVENNGKSVDSQYKIDRKAYIERMKINGTPLQEFEYNKTEEFLKRKKQHMDNADHKKLKNFVWFFICTFFAILSAPVLFVAIEMIIPLIGLIPVIGQVVSQMLGYDNKKWVFEQIQPISFIESKHTFAGILCSIIAFLVWVVTYAETMKLGWLKGNKTKDLQLFLAILICMLIGTFFALLSNFKMFSALWNIPSKLINLFVLTLGPIAALVFTAISTFYSYKNYKQYRHRTSE